MSENSTGNIIDRTDLAKLDRMTEEEVEEAARSYTDSLLLEDCDMSTLKVIMPQAKEAQR